MTSKSKRLSNIVIIRLILIFLLVFFHAFAIYSGAWAPIDGFPEIKTYWWLDKLSFAFMLEMFVFISGYLLGFQVRIKGEEKLRAKAFFWGKFKRLMIPCLVFSLLYIIIFEEIKQPVISTAYDLLNGAGHMWFLPMLFWCFAATWIIEKMSFPPKWVIPILLVFSLVSFLPSPLRITRAMYYMPFFYIGYILQKNDICLEQFYTLKHGILATFSFLVLFYVMTLLRENIASIIDVKSIYNQVAIKAFLLAVSKLLQITYAIVGLCMLLVWVGYGENKLKNPVSGWILNLGNLCFGVYIFQQFILQGLYEYTILPDVLGCYWLPWVGFGISLLGSISLSYVFRLTKIGRFFIG